MIRKSIFATSRRQLQHRVLSSLVPLLWLVPTLVLSYFAAFQLRFDGSVPPSAVALLLATVPLVALIKTTAFLAAQMPLSCHAFVSLYDAYRLVRGSIFATACIAMLDLFWLTASHIPRGVILIDCCLTTLLIGGILTFRRVLRERREGRLGTNRRTKVLLIGGPASVELMLRAISVDHEKGFQAIGILTSSECILHRSIGRVPVLGSLEDLEKVLSKLHCEKIMLSGGDLSGGRVRQIISIGKANGLDVCVVPDASRMISGCIDFRPRDVAIEDLLGRPAISIDQTNLSDWLAGKRVLVTGSCGSIGSELSRQLLALNPEKLLLVDRSETGQFHLGRELSEFIENGKAELIIADINDAPRLKAIFECWEPEVVFHAAAYKHVPLMEQHPGEGIKNIVGATKILADLSDAFNVETFVLISTDKAVNPTSVMGCCKRVAELYIQSMAAISKCNYVTVRFGNVLDSAGSVIPIFREQIAKGGPVTVTHPEMTRFFMTIPEASQLVLQAALIGQGGDIYVLDMGAPVKIRDLAEDMIRLSGLRVGRDIEIVYTGMRQGEKLYEELYDESETQLQTSHPKILRAVGRVASYRDLIRQIQNTLDSANSPNNWILQQLHILVPSFSHAELLQRKPNSPQITLLPPAIQHIA